MAGCGKRKVNGDGAGSVSAGPYIVHGTDSVPGRWPWHVAIELGGNLICGGSLLDEFHVVTAAHCFKSVQTRLACSLFNIIVKIHYFSLPKQIQTNSQ